MRTDVPLVAVTVHFDRQPVTGIQLAALLKWVVEEQRTDKRYVVDRGYYNGIDLMSFGQISPSLSDRIRLVPLLTGLPFFDPNAEYIQAEVTSHSWGRRVRSGDYNKQAAITAVEELAAALTTAYQAARIEGFPEYDETYRDALEAYDED